ncbi:MAG TPA: restriction endonuclease [Candidatus Binataceae bacterium]|nr:restriction endonuclease [Candidatus Binataceae bacterium]
MAIWLVRAGRHGEQEEMALEKGMVVVGWDDLPDLTPIKSREALAQLLRETYPDEGPNKLANWNGQLWAFRDRIQKEDLVVLPLKGRSAIAIGRVNGAYSYQAQGKDYYHTRSVKWLKTDIPRTAFDQDLLYSFGAFMTVCQISRNNAELRIKAVLEGKKTTAPVQPLEEVDQINTDGPVPTDIPQYAEDRIRAFIEQKFKGHGLARVVDALLKATGYTTALSPPGPDGGVDIVAGRGPMGFDQPRLCVQVKSSSGPVNVEVIQRLHGSMKGVGADQGLFISWGGFNSKVPNEHRNQFFSVRLWDSGDLIQALLENYEKLSPDIQAELPLKRIWVLVE